MPLHQAVQHNNTGEREPGPPSRGEDRKTSHPCRGDLAFGAIRLSDAQTAFLKEWNREVLLFSKSLPKSTQTDALLFFINRSGLSFGGEIDFFKSYYVPTWSVIYWLSHCGPRAVGGDPAIMVHARAAHSMALFLHAVDDHLNDGQIPVTHLALLLRSQAWLIMNRAFQDLACGVAGGAGVIEGFLDAYYESIRREQPEESLDDFCSLFRKQMATGMIVPALMMTRANLGDPFSRSVLAAYGSFGIAWRLLDDIQDMESDMKRGTATSVSLCLPEDSRALWEKGTLERKEEERDRAATVLASVREVRVVRKLVERIRKELESAAAVADGCGMTGWADEFRCLLAPLKNG